MTKITLMTSWRERALQTDGVEFKRCGHLQPVVIHRTSNTDVLSRLLVDSKIIIRHVCKTKVCITRDECIRTCQNKAKESMAHIPPLTV